MNTFRGEDHVENNCTLCKHFKSYEDDYCDDMEPSDQGFCSKGKNDNYGDATISCELFEKIKAD